MATKARQQYDADGISLQKESREFSIADEIQQKIDSIEEGAQVNTIETVKVNGTALVPDANKAVDIDVPEVIDNLYTVDSDNALSAKQGKVLYDYIQNIASRGRFLSNWNSATGLPMTNPSESPYPYKSGDYFIVSNVAGLGGTNYRPDGSSYVIGQASTVVETDGVDVSDFYFYDGTNWLLLKNSGRSGAVDSSLSTTSTNPVENRVVTNALNGKQETLIAGNNIQIAADGKTISATNTTYSTATSSTSGLVKLGSDTVQSVAANAVSSTADRTYAVQLNSNDQMVVNVPWSDTTVSSATSSVAGTLKLNSDTVQSEAAQTVSSTANRTYGLQVNSSGQGVVNVPWADTTYTGGTGIEIGNISDYSAMQGPCPDSFHIPLYTEWRDLCGILTNTFGLSASWDNAKTYLKLPPAGKRSHTDSNVTEQNSIGEYWASSIKGTSGYVFVFDLYNFLPTSATFTSMGCSIRPFKDVCVIPDNTWTTLYDGSGITPGAGIFHNSTLGLISISGDGTNRTTIADKNLGATTVWNSGDTLSEANCGKYYQRGNNYGFPFTGSVTTSSTQVDASNYGPGNYYNSSTFITRSSSPYAWDTTDNGNLRGGETGVVTLNNAITNTGVLSVNGQTGDVTIQTGGTYTGGTGINIDVNNEISNTLPGPTIAATAPTGTEGALWYDTTNDVLMAHDGTNWKEAGTQMKILSYGHSTWQDFLNAYNKNAIVYCRASSSSNPGTGSQTRLAFMAYVNNETAPTEVEFQYYRSRSDHNTAANQLDQVFVYKLTSASGGTWTVTERNTAAKAVAGTGISLTFGSGNMTISADTATLATKTYVDEHDTVVSATAPSSPTEGMVWYDTTNDQLKVYDGTNWNVTGKEYNAGEGISIGSVQSYAAMQGPAPTGYHIPSKNEWSNVKTIWEALGGGSSDGSNFGVALKLPYAGMRDFSYGDSNYQGSQGYYWAAERSDTEYSYCLSISSSTIAPSNGSYNANANSIRPFKDVSVVPTASWAKLYGTSIEAGGIFWSNADGLISLSSDGQTWITIADKNLGATTVWNSGDTLSEANCGKYYQWGNNYGFDWAGTLSDFSPLQVDASAYGPGNYYSSSTYVFVNRNWDSSINYNLWGGTTGVIITDNVISNTGVTSVNGQTGDVTIESGGLQVAPNSPITGIKYVWYGTEADYANLSQYYTDNPGDTEYHTF